MTREDQPVETRLAQDLFANALVHHQAGRLAAALQSYRALLRLKPDFADAHCNMGVVLKDLGRLSESLAAYRAAFCIQGTNAAACYNLGNALHRLGRRSDAVAAFRAAVILAPDFAEIQANLGLALKDLGRLDEAARAYGAALRLRPDQADSHANWGRTALDLGRLDEAVAAYRVALGLRPDDSDAHANLGLALKQAGRPVAAIAAYRAALRVKPDFAEVQCNLGNALNDLGRPDEALVALAAALRSKPDFAEAQSSLLMSLHYHPGVGGKAILEQASQFAGQIEAHCKEPSFARPADPDRRLRIGYVSPDFRQHSVAWFFEPLLAAHDRRAVEIFCYADVWRPDAVTERLRRKADHWRSGVGLSDAALADLILQDHIDILVDLAGHTSGNRLRLFAAKPAPVQASWLGYPGTTGLTRIDYRLVDAVTDPADQPENHNSETLLRLADGFLCYGPPSDAPLPLVGTRPDAAVTFGSFNNPAKLSPATLDAWATLLAGHPESRLLLKGPAFADPASCAEFLGRFRQRGIDDDRIALVGHLPVAREHLALYHQVDIALDPFPYNGTTTSCEALWMGVPVVTLRGERHSGRVGASILHRLGLDELVAETVEDYVAIAARLAGDPTRRRALRRSLRDRMAASPLCDAPRLARSLEAAYRFMWRGWCDRRMIAD